MRKVDGGCKCTVAFIIEGLEIHEWFSLSLCKLIHVFSSFALFVHVVEFYRNKFTTITKKNTAYVEYHGRTGQKIYKTKIHFSTALGLSL